jgi:sRNA-binding regulator protein Hfq
LIIEHDGSDHMLFKHAIAAIKTPKSVSNYFSHS